MKNIRKKIPKFKNEDQERDFWATHDSSQYVDWTHAKKARFANLRLSTATISLRLPEGMLEEVKILAQKRDVPYQSLIKMMIDSKIREERH